MIDSETQRIIPDEYYLSLTQKPFICTNNPSQSFILKIEELDYYGLDLDDLYHTANSVFSSKNKHFKIIKESLKSFYSDYPDTSHLLVNSQFNLMPIYFQDSQVSFEMTIEYIDNDQPIYNYNHNSEQKIKETILLDLPYDISQIDLLNQLSTKFNIPKQKQPYLMKDKQVIQKPLNQFNKIQLHTKQENIIPQKISLSPNQNKGMLQDDEFEKTLENGCTNLENLKNPTQQFKFIYKDELQISIKQPKQNDIILHAHCSDRVIKIKERIKEMLNVSEEKQRLYYLNQRLENEKRLLEYNIEINNCSFQLIIEEDGGAESRKFVDIGNDESKKVSEFSKNAPEYRISCNGINLEGYCKNKECPYYQKLVISQQGYKTIEIINDLYDKITCPHHNCDQPIKLITCGFSDCIYSLNGAQLNDKKKTQHVKKERQIAVKGKYTRYNPTKEDGSSNIVLWKQLYIVAEPLPKKKDIYKCSICLKEINTENEITEFELCLEKNVHKCHKKCKSNLSNEFKTCTQCIYHKG